MVKRSQYSLILILLLIAATAWWWPNDEKEILQQLKTLTELSSKQTQEQGVEALTKAAQIGALFTDPCQVEIEAYSHNGSYSRKDIIDRIIFIRNRPHPFSVSLDDTTITLEAADGIATVIATLQVRGLEGDEMVADVQEIALVMNKQEGEWLIGAATVVEVLRR